MNTSLKQIFQAAEEDIEKIKAAALSPANRELAIESIKKACSESFICQLHELLSTSDDSPGKYDYIRMNFFDVTIKRVVVAEGAIDLKKKTGTKVIEWKEKIRRHLIAMGCVDVPDAGTKVMPLSRLSAGLAIDQQYLSNLLYQMRKDGVVENIPREGWFVCREYAMDEEKDILAAEDNR